MRRALMELALCHYFWAAYDIKKPPIPGAVMRCESVIACGPGMAASSKGHHLVLSRNSPPLERILDSWIAQVAGSWLELVLPVKRK